ncbi:MAG: adenylosuccinate synthase [Anaerolineaceae bacterium]|nr:adenylosuccinate synthase [Anaerolineaceae bacterium]
MTLQIVIGTQWGDEGKGRFVDLLSAKADVVARFAGGDNAGHTIRIGDEVYKLHLIPSGLIYPQTVGVIGSGTVVNPSVLLHEMESLRGAGVIVNQNRLKISYAAHMITPAHLALDRAREASLGKARIGTTVRGIGPAYIDKARRSGVQYHDLLDMDYFKQRLTQSLENANRELTLLYGAEPVDIVAVMEEYLSYAEILAPHIADTSALVLDALEAGKHVIAEGAQGALLDIDHGSYPYVTSSSCVAANALVGLGIGMPDELSVVGIVKTFQTRVGSGPFPTELEGETASMLRGDGTQQWDEFGTTTGRPRRIGWLDGMLLKRVVRMNGVTELGLTKLDVLSGIAEIQFCTDYKPSEGMISPLLARKVVEPVYETFQGWDEDIMDITRWEDLPQNAQRYVNAIEAYCGVPVRWISVGPERSQVIYR